MLAPSVPERDEGGGAAVEDGGAHLGEPVGGALGARALADDEGVRDVRRVVDAQPDGDDQVVARHRVDGQAPKVHEAADLHEAQDDAELLTVRFYRTYFEIFIR